MQTKHIKMSFEEFLHVNGRAICLSGDLFKDIRNNSVLLLLCLFPDLPDEFSYYSDFNDVASEICVMRKQKNIVVREASWELWKPLVNNCLEYSFKNNNNCKEMIDKFLFNPAMELLDQMKDYYATHFEQNIIIKPFE